MAELNVRRVDPRDINSEIDHPVYRVYFWSRYQGDGFASREFEVAGAPDLISLLAWADENAAEDESRAIYVVVSEANRKYLIRLMGEDPTGARRV